MGRSHPENFQRDAVTGDGMFYGAKRFDLAGPDPKLSPGGLPDSDIIRLDLHVGELP